MMIRAEINQTEMKKTIERVNETKRRLLEKIKLINLLPDSRGKKKKGRGLKSVVLGMKKGKLQLTHRNTKDHKRLQATICQ